MQLLAAILLAASLALSAQSAAPDASAVPSGMVWLAGGTFMMGTDAARVDALMARFGTKRREFFAAGMPAHVVTLRPFSIDRTEVTNADFNRWMPDAMPKVYAPGEAELPVTFVTWMQASAYCGSIGKRLPSEAEWEFAAGGGRASEFPWGDAMPDTSTANWQGAGIGKPARVGSYPPNAAGLYDMSGNVWEFVEDDWSDDYTNWRNPNIAGSAGSAGSLDRKVIRGGSFGGSPMNLRVRYRDSHPANGPGPHVGFRCARSE
jgi:formylglycine-generating enzyme required for sulfatase activity